MPPLKKLMIIPWVGNLPQWIGPYLSHAAPLRAHGWEFLIFNNDGEFRRLCREKLGIAVPPWKYSHKICEFRPALGAIFEDYLQGCDFWGCTELDLVYGRLSHYVPDTELADLDVWVNDGIALCGAFTLYRNTPAVNRLFENDPRWREILTSREYSNWDEHGSFYELVRNSDDLRVSFNHHWCADFNDFSDLSVRPDGSLWQHGQEIAMFHFNVRKAWPLPVPAPERLL